MVDRPFAWTIRIWLSGIVVCFGQIFLVRLQLFLRQLRSQTTDELGVLRRPASFNEAT